MKSVKYLTLIGLGCASLAFSSLRVRYSFPESYFEEYKARVDYNEEPSKFHDRIKNNPHFHALVEEGAWEGYSETDGFDKVDANNLGVLTGAPLVNATLWVDSLFQERTDAGAYVEDYNTIHDTLLAGGGFFLMTFGQITFPQKGTYELYSVANSGEGLRVWIDFDNNGMLECNNSDFIGLRCPKLESDWQFSYADSSELGVETVKLSSSDLPFIPIDDRNWIGKKWAKKVVNIPTDGAKYRFKAWHWNYSEIDNGGFFWKLPGSDKMVQVPASAFGVRREMGPPTVDFTKVELGAMEIPGNKWDYIQPGKCEIVKFTVEAKNMLGKPATFEWQMKEGAPVITTTTNTLEYAFPDKDLYFPKVRVKREQRISNNPTKTIFIMPAEGCPTSISRTRPANTIGVRVSGTKLFLSNPNNEVLVVSLFNTRGEKVLSGPTERTTGGEASLDFSKCPLTKGTYMVRVMGSGNNSQMFTIQLK